MPMTDKERHKLLIKLYSKARNMVATAHSDEVQKVYKALLKKEGVVLRAQSNKTTKSTIDQLLKEYGD